jgi:hypothetical protein
MFDNKVDFMLNFFKEKRDQLNGLDAIGGKAQPNEKRYHKFYDKLNSNKTRANFKPITVIDSLDKGLEQRAQISPDFLNTINKIETATLRDLMKASFFNSQDKAKQNGKQPEASSFKNKDANHQPLTFAKPGDAIDSLINSKYEKKPKGIDFVAPNTKKGNVLIEAIDPSRYSLFNRLKNPDFNSNSSAKQADFVRNSFLKQVDNIDKIIEDIGSDKKRGLPNDRSGYKEPNSPAPYFENHSELHNTPGPSNYEYVDGKRQNISLLNSTKLANNTIDQSSFSKKQKNGSSSVISNANDNSNYITKLKNENSSLNSQKINNLSKKLSQSRSQNRFSDQLEEELRESIKSISEKLDINDSKLTEEGRTRQVPNSKYVLREFKDAQERNEAEFFENNQKSTIEVEKPLAETINSSNLNKPIKNEEGEVDSLPKENLSSDSEHKVVLQSNEAFSKKKALRNNPSSINESKSEVGIEENEDKSENSVKELQPFETSNTKKKTFKIQSAKSVFQKNKRKSGVGISGTNNELLVVANETEEKPNLKILSKKFSNLLQYDFEGGEKINEKLEDGLIVIKLAFGKSFYVSDSNKGRIFYVVIDLPDKKRLISKKAKGTDSPNFGQLMTSQIGVTSRENQFLTIKLYEKSNRLFKLEDCLGFVKLPFDDCFNNPNQWKINSLFPLSSVGSMNRTHNKSYLGEVYIQGVYWENSNNTQGYEKSIPSQKFQLENLIKFSNPIAGIVVFKIIAIKDVMIFGRKPQQKISFEDLNISCTAKYGENFFKLEKKKFSLSKTLFEEDFQIKVSLGNYSSECLRLELFSENKEKDSTIGFCEIPLDEILRNPNKLIDKLASFINNDEHGNRRIGDMYVQMKYFQGIKKDFNIQPEKNNFTFKQKPTYVFIKLLAVENLPLTKSFYIASKVQFKLGSDEVLSNSVKNEICPIFNQEFVMIMDLDGPEKERDLKIKLFNSKTVLFERNLLLSNFLSKRNEWNSVEITLTDTCKMYFEVLIMDHTIIEKGKQLVLPPFNFKDELYHSLKEANNSYQQAELRGRLRVNILKARDLIHPEGKLEEKINSFVQIKFPNNYNRKTEAQFNTFDPNFNEGFFEDLIIPKYMFKHLEISAHRFEDGKFLGKAILDCNKLLKSPRIWAIDHYYDLFEKEENLNVDEDLISLGKIEIQSMWIPVGCADPGSKYDTKDQE